MTSFPEILVEISPSTPPAGPAVWEDVTPWVMAWSWKCGRNYELDRIQAGKGSVTFLNMDRRFDPFNVDSPYYPGVKPSKRIRIQATWDGTTYPICAGYIDSWPQQTTGFELATVKVNFTDAFKILTLAKVSGVMPEERSDERVNRIINAVGYSTGQAWILGDPVHGVLGTTTVVGPVSSRAIGAGTTIIAEETLNAVSALAHLQDVTDAENGLLFIDAEGSVVFQGRRRMIRAPYTVSQATFGDRPIETGDLPYVRVRIDDDDTHLWNDVTITRDGGTAQTATDATSVDAYFKRSLSKTGLPLTTDEESLSSANWLLGQYKEPAPRISEMDLNGVGSPDLLWPAILPRAIGDRITIRHHPVGGSPDTFDAWLLGSFGLGTAGEVIESDADWAINQEAFIQGIQHDWRLSQNEYSWLTHWRQTPADTRIFWQLGDSIYGVLGVSTIPAYAIFGLILCELMIRLALAFAPVVQS